VRFKPDEVTVAWVEYLQRNVVEPGWYVQYILARKVRRVRLEIERGADAFGAVEAAAVLLGCGSHQVEVRGTVWPEPLHGEFTVDGVFEFFPEAGDGLLMSRRRRRPTDH